MRVNNALQEYDLTKAFFRDMTQTKDLFRTRIQQNFRNVTQQNVNVTQQKYSSGLWFNNTLQECDSTKELFRNVTKTPFTNGI
jgi:hypothetical protein